MNSFSIKIPCSKRASNAAKFSENDLSKPKNIFRDTLNHILSYAASDDLSIYMLVILFNNL